jgi:hypothetical protein
MMLEVTCVGYQSILGWIHNESYNEPVLKPPVLVNAVGRDKINTRRVGVLNILISPIDLL